MIEEFKKLLEKNRLSELYIYENIENILKENEINCICYFPLEREITIVFVSNEKNKEKVLEYLKPFAPAFADFRIFIKKNMIIKGYSLFNKNDIIELSEFKFND